MVWIQIKKHFKKSKNFIFLNLSVRTLNDIYYTIIWFCGGPLDVGAPVQAHRMHMPKCGTGFGSQVFIKSDLMKNTFQYMDSFSALHFSLDCKLCVICPLTCNFCLRCTNTLFCCCFKLLCFSVGFCF